MMEQMIRDAFDTVACDAMLKKRTYDRVTRQMGGCRKKTMGKMKWAVSMACLLIFAVTGVGSYGLYYTEAAVISIDVNPSIELDINRWGKVVDQTTYGLESEKLLQSLSLKHMEYGEAMALLLGSEEMKKYLKQDSLVSITLVTKNDDPTLLPNLKECVDTALKQCHDGIKTEYASVNSHLCEEAHEQGMSLGKYYAIQELLTVDPQATLDEFKEKSMKEIKGHTEHCQHREQGKNREETKASQNGSKDESPQPPETEKSSDKRPEEHNTGHNGTNRSGTGHNGTGYNGTKHSGTGHNGTGYNGTKHNGTRHNDARHH
ncbi:hypothetical protein [Clostridium sp. MCC353]|uniref:anti-sigma-I factor RsgI family protein n=1 Tax=Clostridium sp. MCC353 TaxID=2592646 RepID=UPI00207B0748|nr:hypothetical protein [Clostridium sp. MCC353]